MSLWLNCLSKLNRERARTSVPPLRYYGIHWKCGEKPGVCQTFRPRAHGICCTHCGLSASIVRQWSSLQVLYDDSFQILCVTGGEAPVSRLHSIADGCARIAGGRRPHHSHCKKAAS